MTFRKTLLILILAGASSAAVAQSSGTPEEQAACRPDVRRFCGKLPPGAGDMEYLKCLEVHRDDLTKKCLAVLVDHGR
jgi:hypothetical protein